VAFAVFLLVRLMNRWMAHPAPVTPSTRDCPYCLMQGAAEGHPLRELARRSFSAA